MKTLAWASMSSRGATDRPSRSSNTTFGSDPAARQAHQQAREHRQDDVKSDCWLLARSSDLHPGAPAQIDPSIQGPVLFADGFAHRRSHALKADCTGPSSARQTRPGPHWPTESGSGFRLFSRAAQATGLRRGVSVIGRKFPEPLCSGGWLRQACPSPPAS